MEQRIQDFCLKRAALNSSIKNLLSLMQILKLPRLSATTLPPFTCINCIRLFKSNYAIVVGHASLVLVFFYIYHQSINWSTDWSAFRTMQLQTDINERFCQLSNVEIEEIARITKIPLRTKISTNKLSGNYKYLKK